MQRVPMNKIQTGILLVLLFFGLSTFAQTPGKSGIRRTGTFSTFEYNKEGGDVLGVEIRIVRTRTGYQAVVQFAEGEPGDLIVAPVTFEGQKVRFQIPTGQGPSDTFEGAIGAQSLVGKFSRGAAAGEVLKLPRRKSYWD